MNKPLNIPFALKPINQELLNTFQQLDNNQLQWLSGYCAGLAKSNASLERENLEGTDPNEGVSSRVKTLVLYASQTGNSESIAKKLHDQLNNEPLSLKIDSLDNTKTKDLIKYDLVLLVVSTHGEGEPPDEAIDFYEQLHSKRAPKLTGKQHAVLALGDSSYEHFCQTGRDFDERLTMLGSKPILARLDCDLDYEESSDLWINKLVKLIQEQSNDNSSHNLTSNLNHLASQLPSIDFNKLNPLTAKVIANQKITGKGSSKTVHHIELSLEGETFGYLPGDGIAIWAKNDNALIDNILSQLNLSGEENIQFNSVSQSLSKTLSEKLELTLLNKKTIDLIIALLESNEFGDIKPSEKESIEIEQFKQQVTSPEFIKNNQFIDVLLLANKKINISSQQLVDLLPAVKARVYSISSSQSANPDELHITVGLSQSENERGIRKGMASQFLIESLEEDENVLIYLESNNRFRLPEHDKPIIMIGPGTGVAPFRAFVQEREENNSTGENWLFFGNAHFNTDFLYQTEWQKWLKDKHLFKLDVAFSRDQEKKIYVQDKLKENAAQIWQWLDQKDACLYVCGDMTYMAKDVQQTLLEMISQQGNKSKDDADAYLKQLRKDNRYQRDVY
ncbi:MAG: sulfite reductase (NADPH) flavoprotein alpha-component [Polaribacter sp.]|jgi:sulfite reductase (NADPH) flavoprotein alpha-component